MKISGNIKHLKKTVDSEGTTFTLKICGEDDKACFDLNFKNITDIEALEKLLGINNLEWASAQAFPIEIELKTKQSQLPGEDKGGSNV